MELGAYVDTGEPCLLEVSELVTGRTAVVAKTGYGKSWTMRRVAEGLLELGLPVGVIDPEGEHVSLADSYDMLVISPEGDLDLARGGSPERLARAALSGVSFVLDLSGYSADPKTAAEVTSSLLRSLMDQRGEGFLVMIDEARELAPERNARSILGKYASETAVWVNSLATRGRKRGIGLLFTTQRPQLVSKTLLSQAENKILLRVEYNADLSVMARFLGLDRELMGRIRRLERGEAYVEGPFVGRPGLVKVGGVKTAHLGTTPSVKPRPPPSLADVVAYVTAGPPSLPSESEGREVGKGGDGGKGVGGRRSGRVIRDREAVGTLDLRLESAWSMPSERLTSGDLEDLVRARDEVERMLGMLEESKGEMRAEVYEFLRGEYERSLEELERAISPYRREAIVSELVLEAALKDREMRIRYLRETRSGIIGRIRAWREIRRMEAEMGDLSDRLARVREILARVGRLPRGAAGMDGAGAREGTGAARGGH